MNKKRTGSGWRRPGVEAQQPQGAPQGQAGDQAGPAAQSEAIRADDGRSRLFVEVHAPEPADEPVELELFPASDLPPAFPVAMQTEVDPVA